MDIFSDEAILAQLNKRYATKRFDSSKKIPASDLNLLKEVMRLSPSSYGLQPWKFLLVKDREKLAALRKASWDQPQIEECSDLIVFTTLKKMDAAYVSCFIERVAAVRNVPVEQLKDYEAMIVGDLVNGPRAAAIQSWAQRQAYLAMGFLLEAAALKGIDACPMEGLSTADYDQILGLTSSDYGTVAVVALGYRSSTDNYQSYAKVRFETAEIFETID